MHFDFRSGFVQLLVVRQLLRAAAVRGDDRLATLLAQPESERIRVVGLVSEQTLRRRPGDESWGGLAVVALALGDLERQRKPKGIDKQMYFR